MELNEKSDQYLLLIPCLSPLMYKADITFLPLLCLFLSNLYRQLCLIVDFVTCKCTSKLAFSNKHVIYVLHWHIDLKLYIISCHCQSNFVFFCFLFFLAIQLYLCVCVLQDLKKNVGFLQTIWESRDKDSNPGRARPLHLIHYYVR